MNILHPTRQAAPRQPVPATAPQAPTPAHHGLFHLTPQQEARREVRMAAQGRAGPGGV
jgi:hypothetical protein